MQLFFKNGGKSTTLKIGDYDSFYSIKRLYLEKNGFQDPDSITLEYQGKICENEMSPNLLNVKDGETIMVNKRLVGGSVDKMGFFGFIMSCIIVFSLLIGYIGIDVLANIQRDLKNTGNSMPEFASKIRRFENPVGPIEVLEDKFVGISIEDKSPVIQLFLSMFLFYYMYYTMSNMAISATYFHCGKPDFSKAMVSFGSIFFIAFCGIIFAYGIFQTQKPKFRNFFNKFSMFWFAIAFGLTNLFLILYNTFALKVNPFVLVGTTVTVILIMMMKTYMVEPLMKGMAYLAKFLGVESVGESNSVFMHYGTLLLIPFILVYLLSMFGIYVYNSHMAKC